MDTLANDFLNLPVIVSDYDAICAPQPSPSSPPSTFPSSLPLKSSNSSITSTSTTTAPTSPTGAQNYAWTTGFGDFADELWHRMTARMRQKLREACVEVLKRVDDDSEKSLEAEEARWVYDEDARFLD